MLHNHSYYYGFSAEEYAADEFFQSWVANPAGESDDFWQSYMNLHPAEAKTMDAGKQFVLLLSETDAGSSTLNQIEKQEIRAQIFARLGLDENRAAVLPRVGHGRWLVAASVAAVFAVSTFLFFRSSEKEVEAYVVYTTKQSETREIILPDSSHVILNAASAIRYLPSFGKSGSREVYLQGNAFFKVRKKQDHQSFIVHSNTINVTVLGTEFNVNNRTASTNVELVSGQVKVDANGLSEPAFLKPGDKVELDPAVNRLNKSTFDIRLYSAWTRNVWNFNQTNLEEVFRLISSYYGVKAEFRNVATRNLRITASIPVTDLDMLSLILSKTLHIKINRLNDRVIIQ